MKYIVHSLILALLCSVGSGADIPWKSDSYSNNTLQPIPIPEVLRDFAADQGLPIIIGEEVTAPVTVKYDNVAPQEFLNDFTQSNGLIWYFDGAALYITSSSELKSEVLALENVTPRDLIRSLNEMGFGSDRFPIKTLDESGLAFIVGPPRHLELVKQLAELIDERARKRANLENRYRSFFFCSTPGPTTKFSLLLATKFPFPGVASILDGLINGQDSGPVGVSVRRSPRNLNSLIGQGLIRPRNQALARAEEAAVKREDRRGSSRCASSRRDQHCHAKTKNKPTMKPLRRPFVL